MENETIFVKTCVVMFGVRQDLTRGRKTLRTSAIVYLLRMCFVIANLSAEAEASVKCDLNQDYCF